MPAVNISKNQPRKAKGLGGVFPLRSKNAALLYMYRFALIMADFWPSIVTCPMLPFDCWKTVAIKSTLQRFTK